MEDRTSESKKRKKEEQFFISVELHSSKKQKRNLEGMLNGWADYYYLEYTNRDEIDSNGRMYFTLESTATSHVTVDQAIQRIAEMLKKCGIKEEEYFITNHSHPEEEPTEKKAKKNEDSMVISPISIDENNISEYIESIKVILQQRNIDQGGFNEYLKNIVKNHLGYLQEGFVALLHASKLNEANFYLDLLKIAKEEGKLDETIYAYYVNMFIDHSDYPQFLDELNKKQELKAEKSKEVQESNASNEKEEVQEDIQELHQRNASEKRASITNYDLVKIEKGLIKPLADRSYDEKKDIRQMIKNFGVDKLRNAFMVKLTGMVDFEILANASDVLTDTPTANSYINKINTPQIRELNAALAGSRGKGKAQDFINLMLYLYWADKTTLHTFFNKIPNDCVQIKELILCVSAYKSLASMEKIADKVSQRDMYGSNQLAILKRSKSLENVHQIMEEDGFKTDEKVRSALKNETPPRIVNPTEKDIKKYNSQRAGYFAQVEQVAKRFGKGNLVEMEMETMKIQGEKDEVPLHVDFSTLNKLVEVKHYSTQSNLSGYNIDLKGFSNLGEILNYILPCAIHKKPIQFMLTNDQYNPTFCKELIVLSSLFPESMYLKMTIGAAQKMMEDKDLAPFIDIVKGKENKDGYCLIKVQPSKYQEMFKQCMDEKAHTLRNQEVLPAANKMCLKDNSPLLIDVQKTLKAAVSGTINIEDARLNLQRNYIEALTNKLSPPPPSHGLLDVKPVYHYNMFNKH